MANPTFDGMSLQDSTYITKRVEFRTRAKRALQSNDISRRIGKKFVSQQVQEKVIQVSGIILAANQADLQSAVDALQETTSGIEKALIIEDGRTYYATAERVTIPDQNYTQTMVPFEIQFVAAQPFAIGTLKTVTFVVPSGTSSFDLTTTISGTVPNRPIFRFVTPSGTGTSPVTNVRIQNAATANTLTISGGYNAAESVVVNFDRFLVTVAGINRDYIGQMDDIGPGTVTFTITVSGRNDGIRGSLEYNPRYW